MTMSTEAIKKNMPGVSDTSEKSMKESIDKGFLFLKSLRNYGNWNWCLEESVRFLTSVFTYATMQQRLDTDIAGEITETLGFITTSLENARILPPDIGKLTELYKKLMPSLHPGGESYKRLQEALEATPKMIAEHDPDKNTVHTIIGLFCAGEIGSLDYIWIQRANAHYFCPPLWASDTKSALSNALKSVQHYLRCQGLEKIPEEREFQVDFLGRMPWNINGKTEGPSLGLPAAIKFFSTILSDEDACFAIPSDIAATGEIHFDPHDLSKNGTILKVDAIPYKLRALFREIPQARVYIPKENEGDVPYAYRDKIGSQIFPVSHLEEVFCQLFADGNHDQYKKNLDQALGWRRSGFTPKLKKAVIYWSTAFTMREKQDSWIGKRVQEWAKASFSFDASQKKYICRSFSPESREMSANEIREKAYKEGSFVPTLLENYAVLMSTRYTPEYQSWEPCCRFQLKTEHEYFTKSFAWVNLPIQEAFLNWDNAGIWVLTLQIELLDPTAQILMQGSRESTQAFMNECVSNYLHLLGFNGAFENGRQYRFTVLRGIENYPNREDAMELVRKNTSFFYSLWIGVEQDINEKKASMLLENNQSTRKDVFLVVDDKHALLVESNLRDRCLTEKRIPEGTPENLRSPLIKARQYYNDLNYFLWLEPLLKTRTLLQSKQFPPEVQSEYYHKISGTRIAIHGTYQTWINHWRNLFGIDLLYQEMVSSSVPSKQKEKYPVLSVVGVILDERGRILITKRKVAPFPNRWVMPGGKVEHGEKTSYAVLREVREEVGLEGECGSLLAIKESLPSPENQFRHFFILYYEVKVDSHAQVFMNPDEVSEVAWVDAQTYKSYDITPKAREVLEEVFKMSRKGD